MKVQLLEIQRLKNLTAGHPLMSQALSIREKGLNEQVQALPLGKKESRAVLFFSGDGRNRVSYQLTNVEPDSPNLSGNSSGS